jgi:hypothetical protein
LTQTKEACGPSWTFYIKQKYTGHYCQVYFSTKYNGSYIMISCPEKKFFRQLQKRIKNRIITAFSHLPELTLISQPFFLKKWMSAAWVHSLPLHSVDTIMWMNLCFLTAQTLTWWSNMSPPPQPQSFVGTLEWIRWSRSGRLHDTTTCTAGAQKSWTPQSLAHSEQHCLGKCQGVKAAAHKRWTKKKKYSYEI